MNKRGISLGDLPGQVILLVIVGVVLTVGLSIMATVQSTQTSGTAEYNASTDAINALAQFGDFLPVFVVIVVLAIVVGLLGFLAARRGGL